MTRALTPVDKQVRLSHMQHLRLIRLGDENQANRLKQLEILYWFYKRPVRYQRLGYESFEEYFAQEDVQDALGLSAGSKGAWSKLWRGFKISAIIPEADVLGEGRSKVFEALPDLEPIADAVLEAETPEEAEELRRELRDRVDRVRSRLLSEVQAETQARRESPYRLTANDGHPAIGETDRETGEISIVLVQADDCDPVGFATVVRRLTRNYGHLLYDDDGFWVWAAEGVLKPVARWPHADVPQSVKQRIATLCRAERRI